ncbi:MAG: glycosyltransferase [Methanobacteriaceae archaeon]|jgi:glycosyltransferase involved in cell wall biosynthesis|nr:glycosyltransferase [Candidatus Methanorudis spinitermitis]
MREIKVSVIVPVYNSEKYLEKCLDSLINQTLSEIEIICVDDGSTDTSPELLNAYSKKDNRVKIITQENKDVGAARKAGIKIAKGEYIAFTDDDDWIAKDSFEKLYKNAKSNNSDLVMFKVVFYYPHNESYVYPKSFNLERYFNEINDYNNFVFKAEDIKEQVLNAFFAPWFKFYKSKFLKKYNFYFKENITYPDVPFHVQALLKAKRISFLPENLYFYRRDHQESMLLISKNTPRIFDIFEVVDEVENFLIENNLMKEYRFEFIQFKLEQINFWFLRCGKSYKDEYFNKSKKILLNMKLSENKLKKLPKIYKKIYLNIVNSNSYREVELLNEINELKNKVKRSKNQKNRLEKRIKNKVSSGVLKTFKILKRVLNVLKHFYKKK